MKSRIVFVFTLFSLLISHSFAKDMFYVKFKVKDHQERTLVANHIHPDVVLSDTIYSIVNEFDLKEIRKNIPHLIDGVQKTIVDDLSTIKSNEYEFPRKDEKFHTYKEAQDELDQFATKYSNIATKFSIGKSVEGRDLLGIRITGESNKKLNTVPGIIFVATHHAREHLSTEIPMLMIKHLLENYGKDQRITQLINNRDIYFIPIVNPDGMLHDIKGRKYKMWRKNRRNNDDGNYGVDLNRNYGFGWGTGGSSRNTSSDVYMGPRPFSEPETKAVKAFVESKPNVRIVTSFHTFSELILYPWGGRNEGIGGIDQKVHETMAKKMSKWNKYTPKQASGLYIASGDTCDWAYGELGMFCFTFELTPKSMWSGGFYPGAKVIDKTFQANIKPILYLIEHSADPYAVVKNEKSKYNFAIKK